MTRVRPRVLRNGNAHATASPFARVSWEKTRAFKTRSLEHPPLFGTSMIIQQFSMGTAGLNVAN